MLLPAAHTCRITTLGPDGRPSSSPGNASKPGTQRRWCGWWWYRDLPSMSVAWGTFPSSVCGGTATLCRPLGNQLSWPVGRSRPSFGRWPLSGAGGLNGGCHVVVRRGRLHTTSPTVSCLGETRTSGRRAGEAPSRKPCWQASHRWSHGWMPDRQAGRGEASSPNPVGD